MGIDELRQEIIKLGKRPIAFFGKDWGFGCVRLFVALADDANSQIYLSSAIFGQNDKSYESITQDVPSFHIFEREFYEQFGIEPLHHPWLKPLRKNQDKYFSLELVITIKKLLSLLLRSLGGNLQIIKLNQV